MLDNRLRVVLSEIDTSANYTVADMLLKMNLFYFYERERPRHHKRVISLNKKAHLLLRFAHNWIVNEFKDNR
jgi:hypothetical protein